MTPSPPPPPRPAPTGEARSVPDPRPTLSVAVWADPVIDDVGHDPRSAYVEQFWLGVLGPSTTWLLRRIAAGFDRDGDPFTLDIAETARAIGLGDKSGRNSPFQRALGRMVTFDMARWQGSGALAVRRRLPPLARRHLLRLPPSLQRDHVAWQGARTAATAAVAPHQRARQLALSLAELGEDREAIERQLTRWRIHPAMAHQAAGWAWLRRTRRVAAATAGVARPVAVGAVSPREGS